ncbi:MAG TPA: phosphotransferase [Streptosporangiaceae bacterium]|nr:phosphotransferase [Streptosporangiaceae bacterium]
MTLHHAAAVARPVPPGPAAGHGRSDLRGLLSVPGIRKIVLDGSRDPNSGVTVLLMPAAAAPTLAVKIGTTPAAADVIEREAKLLAAVRGLGLQRTGRTLPWHVSAFDADGMLAVASSAVPGVPMRTRYHSFRHLARPDLVRADFAAAGGWLADLHADSGTEPAPVTILDGVPEQIAARWPGDEPALILAEKLRTLGTRLAAASTIRTVVHGDFWAGNLLVTGNTVTGVVDWAAGQVSGEPLRDVARFALSYALYLDRHTRPGRPVAGHPELRADRWGAGIEYAIAGRHWFGGLVRDFVAGALARLGAPPGLWRDVLLAGLGEVAATADHPDFAIRHRDLGLRLISEVPR